MNDLTTFRDILAVQLEIKEANHKEHKKLFVAQLEENKPPRPIAFPAGILQNDIAEINTYRQILAQLDSMIKGDES